MNRRDRRVVESILTAACLVGLIACSNRSGDDSNRSKIQFTEPDYFTSEDMRSASISVSRLRSSIGVVTVDYATSDGTATAGDDYTATSGTLTWADGDTADKTFTIPLRDDGCVEGPETIDLSLGNPTGNAGLGRRAMAVLSIADNDVVPSGSLDPVFGLGGVVVSNPSAGSDVFTAVALGGSFLYAVGWDNTPGGMNWQWRIEKRALVDGSPDPGFGIGGVVTSNPGPGDATPFAVAVDATFVYIVGYDDIPGPSDWQWRIEKRSIVDGNLDPLFGAGGVLSINPGSYSEMANGIALDGSSMYVIGDDSSPGFQDWQWRIEKRSLVDGTLDPAFGPGGVVTSDPSPSDDTPYDISIDATSIYVIGYDCTPGAPDHQWRIEKRSLVDGTLDPAFGPGGVVTSDPTPGYDLPFAMEIDASFIYAVGYEEVPPAADWQWRIEKRSIVDGSFDPSFGTGGVVLENPSPATDEPWSVAIDAGYIYVAGFDESQGDQQWRIEKRSLLDGSPDPCFGTGGVIVSNPSIDDEIPWRIAVDASALYVVGEDASTGATAQSLRIEKRLK